MNRLKLFDVPADESVQQKKHPQPPAEERFPHLDFSLIPILALAGKFSDDKMPQPEHFETKRLLLRAFLLPPVLHKSKLLENIRTYFAEEGPLIKKDSRKALRNGNVLGAVGFEEMVVRGAKLLLGKKGTLAMNPEYVRNGLPYCDPKLIFSKTARYILNGLKDRYWYRDNAELTKEMFKHFPPTLIPELFAATSIRNDLKGNVTKMFKALDQYYKKNIGTIFIGKEGEKQKMISYFKGFLDAQIYQLEAIVRRESFGNGKKNKARKIRNFSMAMQGHAQCVVVDIWLMRAFGTDIKRPVKGKMVSASPPPALYDAIEWYVQTAGFFLFMEPRELSAMLWSGIRSEENTDETRYTQIFEKRLSHGLFQELYGALMPSEAGVYFHEKVSSAKISA
jgi:hypothetical protein